MTSFHNTCTIGSKPGHEGAWCFNHGVAVYRDGIDWLTLPRPK